MQHDYDLKACLEYNGQSFDISEIERVLAIWEGENDGDDWRWILQLTNDRFAFLLGWCDYTGWDCQSGAMSKVVESAQQAAKCVLEKEFVEWQHAVSPERVFESLSYQLEHGVNETWRARMDKELGIGWDMPIITPSNNTPTD